MTMAKIDSGSRMRLPPDSALKPQPYSEREHAATASQQRTLTEWFQLAQQQRQGQADPTLARAIETALQSHRELTTAQQGHRLTVTVLGPASTGAAGQYEARAGDQPIRIQSAVPLQAGQNLLLTLSPSGPALVVPASTHQQAAMLSVAQQAQLARLPALQPQTNVKSIQTLLNAFVQISQTLAPNAAKSTPNAMPSTATPNNQPTAPQASPNPEARALAVSQPVLTALLSRWANTLPGLLTQATAPTAPTPQAAPQNGSPASASIAAGATPNTGLSTSALSALVAQAMTRTAVQVATSPTSVGSNTSNGGAGQHWISQLVQTAQQQYGSATAQTVRMVWQQWQQGAVQNLTTATAVSTDNKISTPAVTNVSLPSTTSSGSIKPAEAVQTLAQQLPLLSGTKTSDSALKPLAPPNDWWRLAAEQWLDLRTQTQSTVSAKPLSLEEQLRQQAQRMLNQTGPTYSPEQLKRTFALRRDGSHLPNSEQQQLALVRQTLEQVNQQQVARQLFSLGAEATLEQPRILHSIPVWAEQHLVWFDIERHPEPETSAQDANKPSHWCLDVHFHLPPMAPMCARLIWQGEHCAIQFLTDDSATLRMLHEHINDFQQRLQQMGLPVEDVLCRHGLPKRQQRAETAHPSSHRVDIRT